MQAVIDMSRHVNVFGVFAACGCYSHRFFEPDRVEALGVEVRVHSFVKAVGEEGLP